MPESHEHGKLEKLIETYLCSQWEQRGEKLMQRSFKTEHLPMPKNPMPDFAKISQSFPKIMVEIGCGAGHHPYQYAIDNPHIYVFAIEHTKTRFKQMTNLVNEKGALDNFVAIQDNAISWMAHYLKADQVDEIKLMYPNPYPKPKDWNCRWHALPFWGHLLKLLKPDGDIQLVTNIADYAEQTLYFNLKHWKSECLVFKNVQKSFERTLFEKKYHERGETCFEMSFKRRSGS